MNIFYRMLLIATAIMLTKSSVKTTYKFPKLTEFFKKKTDIKKHSRLTQCDVTVHKEQCVFRVAPKKKHCLSLSNLIKDLMPEYKEVLLKTELKHFRNTDVSDIYINTCSNKITYKTLEGNFPLITNLIELTKVEAGISIPIPLGDFQLFGGGEWVREDLKMKVKFNKEGVDAYSIKGYSVKDYVSVAHIGEAFDVDILPNGPISILLKKINMDNFLIRDCKVYGYIQPMRGNYELAFSGEPRKDFHGGNVRVFITKAGNKKNLAILLELQDYSPVTLLKKIYGASITRANVLRDRNQTIAMYISSLPASNFSSVYTSHGSSRWIHRDSTFDRGAYVLVTLPFPKRKALDMKIQLLSDGLSFSIPESENLSGDLILGAISPEKIVHIGYATPPQQQQKKDDKKYTKMKILKFRYFLFNDTYLAAVESHLSELDELAELMPIGRPELLTEGNIDYYRIKQVRNMVPQAVSNTPAMRNLDTFFVNEEKQKDEKKREIEKKVKLKQMESHVMNTNRDPLKMAQEIGLL